MGYRSFYSFASLDLAHVHHDQRSLLPEDYLIIWTRRARSIKPMLSKKQPYHFLSAETQSRGGSLLLLRSCGQKISVVRTLQPASFTSNEFNEGEREIIGVEKSCGFFVQDTISHSDSLSQIVCF